MSRASSIKDHDLSRYHGLLCAAAGTHLKAGEAARAALGEPTSEPEVQAVVPMSVAAEAGRGLIGESVDEHALAQGRHAFGRASQVADGFGHERRVYRALVGHVLRLSQPTSDADQPDHLPTPPADDQPISHVLWHWLWPEYPQKLTPGQVASMIEAADSPAPLRPFHDHPGTLEGWWYHELVALHALANLAWRVGHSMANTLSQRLVQTVDYHLEHTDPDNVSSQPWALAAFLARPRTVGFAERQLHDAEIALAQSEGRSGLVSGLLLADAAHTLAHLHDQTHSH